MEAKHGRQARWIAGASATSLVVLGAGSLAFGMEQQGEQKQGEQQLQPDKQQNPQQGPRRGGGGGSGGGRGAARKPPQDGIVKPEMSDTSRVAGYADNWFAMYINGKLVAVDSIDFLPHNVVAIDILPEYPMTIAVIAKDNADPKTGCEYGRSIGDAGLILKFADGTATDASWKAKCFFHGPIDGKTDDPKVRTEELPANWFAVDFDDSSWANATEYSEERIVPKQPYYDHDFKGAKWIWTNDLDLDNTVLFRKKIEKSSLNPDAKRRWTTKPDIDTSGPTPVK